MIRSAVTLLLLAAAALPAQTTYLITSIPDVQAVGLALAPNGDVYFSDTANNRVQKMDATGIITTVASQAGAAIAMDAAGNIYLLDRETAGSFVRKIDSLGRVSIVAGVAGNGYNGDNIPAATAALNGPSDIAVDAAGNLYIADGGNSRVRRVGADGIITTYAGSGVFGDSGDGGPAADARFEGPRLLTFDPNGNLYIADDYPTRIRKVTPAGIISTVYQQDNTDTVWGFAADAAGNLYLSLTSPGRIVKVSPDGSTTWLAGLNSLPGQDGDGGPSLSARLRWPFGIALLPGNVILFADAGKIRKLEPANIFPLGTVNAASQTGQPLSPGELVTLYWTGLGTLAATQAIGITDPLPTELADTQVLFNGIAAPILYVDARQINVLVPTTLSATDTVSVEAVYQGQKSNHIQMPYKPASPGIFVLTDSSYRPVFHEVERGSTLIIFGTGAGLMTPWPGDGRITLGAGSIDAPVEVRLGDTSLPMDYAGPAPSLIAGVFQLNVSIPASLTPNSYILILRIGDQSTQLYLGVR